MDLVTSTMQRLKADSRRSVHLVSVFEGGGWRAECSGEIVLSFAGPEDALSKLELKLTGAGKCRRGTDVFPAVGGDQA